MNGAIKNRGDVPFTEAREDDLPQDHPWRRQQLAAIRSRKAAEKDYGKPKSARGPTSLDEHSKLRPWP